MKNPRLSGQLVKAIRKEASLYFRNARGSHDWDHTERVLKLCQRIGKKEKANLEVLTLAALLHDIGRHEEDISNGNICHGEKGAALAEAMLKKHGVKKEMAERIIHCIKTHRFRQKRPPQSLEAKVLFDADKLDSIGAVGIGRAFLFAGEVGARLHNPALDLEKTRPYTKEDTAYREFLVKLCKIEGRLFTREGRRIARQRHRFMTEFFDRLNKETQGIL